MMVMHTLTTKTQQEKSNGQVVIEQSSIYDEARAPSVLRDKDPKRSNHGVLRQMNSRQVKFFPHEKQELDAIVSDGISEGGGPIPLKDEMEAAFGMRFDEVRVCVGMNARLAAERLGAEAFTIGNKIVSKERSVTASVLIHELAHIAQQRENSSTASHGLKLGRQNSPCELEARKISQTVLSGHRTEPPQIEAETDTVYTLQRPFTRITFREGVNYGMRVTIPVTTVINVESVIRDLQDTLDNDVRTGRACTLIGNWLAAHPDGESYIQSLIALARAQHRGNLEIDLTYTRHPAAGNRIDSIAISSEQTERQPLLQERHELLGYDFNADVSPRGATLTYGNNRRVILEVAPQATRGPRPYAYEYMQPTPDRDWAVIRIVAAPGVSVDTEGFPRAYVPSLEDPQIEIYRVQDPSLVPEEGRPVLPFGFLGGTQMGVRAPEQPTVPADVVVTRRSDGVDITHNESGITLRIIAPLSSAAARFAYEVILGDSLQVRRGQPTNIRVIRTPAIQVRILGGSWPGGFVDPHIEIYTVPGIADVPRQGESIMDVVQERSLTPMRTIPASTARETTEHAAQLMLADVAIGMVPYAGDVADIEEFVQSGITGEDRWGRPVTQTERMVMGMGAMLPFVSGGALADIARAIGTSISRTSDDVAALLRVARNLQDTERQALERLIREAEHGDPRAIEDMQQMVDQQRTQIAAAAQEAREVAAIREAEALQPGGRAFEARERSELVRQIQEVESPLPEEVRINVTSSMPISESVADDLIIDPMLREHDLLMALSAARNLPEREMAAEVYRITQEFRGRTHMDWRIVNAASPPYAQSEAYIGNVRLREHPGELVEPADIAVNPPYHLAQLNHDLWWYYLGARHGPQVNPSAGSRRSLLQYLDDLFISQLQQTHGPSLRSGFRATGVDSALQQLSQAQSLNDVLRVLDVVQQADLRTIETGASIGGVRLRLADGILEYERDLLDSNRVDDFVRLLAETLERNRDAIIRRGLTP